MLNEFEPGRIMARLLKESMQPSDGPREHTPVPEALIPGPEAGTWLPLPEPIYSGRPLADVLNTRSAIRAYSEEPITLEQLATILAAGANGDARDWRSEVEAGQAMGFLVLAWRVQSLTEQGPGLFQYDVHTHTLRFVTAAPRPDDALGLFLQQEFATAAAVIVVVGGLADALARHGAYGHRLLLMRAGAAAHRGWLAGLSTGLVGSVFAGFIAKSLRDLGAVHGYQNAQLFALAVGNPV